MDSFFTINIYDLKIALQNSLNPFDNNIRIKANNFLFTLKSYQKRFSNSQNIDICDEIL